MPEDTPGPQQGGLLKWLRINVAVAGLGIAVVSGATGAIGAVVTGLVRSSAILRQIDEDHAAIEGLHRDMISVDGRLNGLDRRIAVLEAQIQFLSTRVPTPPVPRR